MRYISKVFLSPDYNESGSMVLKAESERLEDLHSYGAENPFVSASIQVRDCHGTPVDLDFGFYATPEGLEKRERKLDLMIQELFKMKEALPKLAEDARVQAAEWLARDAENPRPRSRSALDILNGDE